MRVNQETVMVALTNHPPGESPCHAGHVIPDASWSRQRGTCRTATFEEESC